MQIIDNVNLTVKGDLQKVIRNGSKMSVAAACFSIYAYQELKKQLEGIEELRFIFTSPTFITEKASKAQREFYKDVIFDTSPVAGKVYKNSENRRKQGVSCGFRCICRCSICPVRAQPWCARC